MLIASVAPIPGELRIFSVPCKACRRLRIPINPTPTVVAPGVNPLPLSWMLIDSAIDPGAR